VAMLLLLLTNQQEKKKKKKLTQTQNKVEKNQADKQDSSLQTSRRAVV